MPDITNFYFLLFGMITIIVVSITLARAWVVTHQASADLEFKSKLLRRGLSAEEIERLMTVSSPRPPTGGDSLSEDSLSEVVSVLGQIGASAEVIEEVLRAFRSVDAPTQELVSSAVQHLFGSADEVDGEQILAVVRPLCEPKAETPAPAAVVRDERVMREG